MIRYRYVRPSVGCVVCTICGVITIYYYFDGDIIVLVLLYSVRNRNESVREYSSDWKKKNCFVSQ